jgi:hypothetical protein
MHVDRQRPHKTFYWKTAENFEGNGIIPDICAGDCLLVRQQRETSLCNHQKIQEHL